MRVYKVPLTNATIRYYIIFTVIYQVVHFVRQVTALMLCFLSVWMNVCNTVSLSVSSFK